MKRHILLVLILFFTYELSPYQFSSYQALAETNQKLPILDGTNVPASDYPEVAELSIKGGLCTGTLIAPNLLLTAAHCFFNDRNKRSGAEKSLIAFFPSGTLRSTRISLHKTYKAKNICKDNEIDAAIVELNSALPGVAPAGIFEGPTTIGQELEIVGYGSDGNGFSGENNNFPEIGTVNTGTTIVDNVANDYATWIFNSGEANTGGGDSGGPAFIRNSNPRIIHSITCGGEGRSQFGTQSYNTRIDKVTEWINSAINTSGIFLNMHIQSAKVFTSEGNNRLNIRAQVDLKNGFRFRKKIVNISTNGFSQTFTLNRKGRARNNNNSKIRILGERNLRRNKLKGKSGRININLKGNDYINFLNSYDFFSNPEIEGSSFNISELEIVIGNYSSKDSNTIFYDSFSEVWQ